MNLDWSEPITWIIILLLVGVLVIQLIRLLQAQNLAPRRKAIRVGLNVLLWLVLATFVLKPTWTSRVDARQALIAAEAVPSSYLTYLKDSLKIQQSFRPDDFQGDFETVTLVGQDFSEDLLSRLSSATLQWIPYYEPDQLQLIHWKGVLRKGEIQRVTGRIQLSREQKLRLRYGNRTLDSLHLTAGLHSFVLQFPAFAQGRTEVLLMRDDEAIDTIRFFAQAIPPLAYQFVLNNPDFESKTLADWLGQQHNTVQLTSLVAKGVGNDVSINRTAKAKDVPDIIVTTPDNAADPIVKKAVVQGKSVLFINLSSPEAEVKAINQALGTNWRVRKVSNEEQVVVGNGLTALPYQFTEAANQVVVSGWPVAIQRNVGKVGVSLLSETFPLKLSGDSLHYSQFWAAVLAQLQPSYTNNVQIDAPLFTGLRSPVRLNNWPTRPQTIRLGTDTVSLTYSAINPLSSEGVYHFFQAGWQPIQDSLAVYVYQGNQQANAHRIREFILARADTALTPSAETTQPLTKSLPAWVWLVLFLFCFSALWLEPKLG